MIGTFKITNRTLVLDLPSGVIRFDPMSGTGKTYFFECIRKLSEYDHSMVTFTFSDLNRGVPLFPRGCANVRLVVMDRCDLYAGNSFIWGQLVDLPADCTVLVDVKSDAGLIPKWTHTVRPKLTERTLELKL